MNRYFLLAFSLILMLAQCKKDEIDQQVSGLKHETISIDGITRRYAVYIPQNYNDNYAYPIVFELHGGGIYIEDMTGESGYKSPYKLWMELSDRENFIVVYPEGLPGAYGKPTWNDCRADCIVNSNADDVHFISTLIDTLSSKYNIDQKRVYISGTSNGGFMALRLAVCLWNKITAVASVAAAMPAVSECPEPSHPISVLFMNGTDDNHMPYNGGIIGNPPNPDHGTALSTDTSVKIWIKINQTDTIPEKYTFPDLDTSDGGIVEKFLYKNGNNGTQVVLYKINGGGHSAPSIQERYSSLYERYFNKQNHDIEATNEIWMFFKDKKRTE